MQPTEDLRTKQIHRQAAAKVSVQLLQYLQPDQQNLASLVAISEQLVKYFDSGVQWNVNPVQPPQPQGQQQHQAAEAQPQQQQAQGYENPADYGYSQPPGDDDIPF